jgi:2',3'-cyclic-nucleotide 2'-phosphodiesterase
MSQTFPAANHIRILFLGDVFGEPGRRAVIELIPKLKESREIDFVIVNGENAATGRGITPKISIALLRAGAAVVTLGDHAFDQGEIMDYMSTEPRLLRAINYPPGTPGHGSVVLETDKGKVGVFAAMGRVFMGQALENPFLAAEATVQALREETKVIICDFHAEATSEKIAFGRNLDGLVSLVVGTHTHVQTADEMIFPNGTAYLTDAGMCGPLESVIGSRWEPVVERFRSCLPSRLAVASAPVKVCGVIVDVDTETGKAVHIERVAEMWDGPAGQV